MGIEDQIRAHACPCCAQQVDKLDADKLVDVCRVSNYQATILRAIWRGKGHPVPTERIFDAMYADDPDGGPSRSAMYNSFKIALCRLRKQIEGTGVGVENAGYGRGYRLVMNVAARDGRLRAIDELLARDRAMQKTIEELHARMRPRPRQTGRDLQPLQKLPESLTRQLALALEGAGKPALLAA